MDKIIGAKGRVRDVAKVLEKANILAKGLGIEIQLIDATMVFGKDHLVSAIQHAKRAFERGANSSSSLSTEVLLYASGERQISEAIEKMGIEDGSEQIAIVLIGECEVNRVLSELNLQGDDSVLEGEVKRLEDFGITEGEIASVPREKVFDLVLEKVAMVDVLK